MNTVLKMDIEKRIKCNIPETVFEKSLVYAERKLVLICKTEEIVCKDLYLEELIVESVKNLMFSQFTINLCRKLYNMEKEHSVKNQSAHEATIL